MITDNLFDAAIIGAGPAGTTAAYILAQKGYKVLIVDKQYFPRTKLCAGLLTWKSIALLNSVFGFSKNELVKLGIVQHATQNYGIYYKKKEIFHNRLDFPFHFVDRKSYDHFWLNLARNAGAEAILGVGADTVNPQNGVITLSDSKKIKAEVIIGADGVWSCTRRSIFKGINLSQRWRSNLAMTIEIHLPTFPEQGLKDRAELYFGFVPWGYAWSFPGMDHRILGICSLSHKNSRSFSKAFKHFLSTVAPHDTIGPTLCRGHALPFGNYLDRPGKGRVMLVGDACGLADPLLGEGVYYAHRSAEIAAQKAILLLEGRLPRNDLMTAYRSTLKQEIISNLNWIKVFRTLLFAGGQQRRFRGLKTLFHFFPHRLEAAIQGKLSFSRLFWPHGS